MKARDGIKLRGSHVCIHGLPKVGKSTLASQLASQGFKLWWFSVDGGHADIFRKLPDADLDNIELFDIIDTKDTAGGIATCRKVMSGGLQIICDTHGLVSCPVCTPKKGPTSSINIYDFSPKDIIVFDNITQLFRSSTNAVMKNKDENDKIEWEQWRKVGWLMDQFLTNIQAQKCHSLCIAHSTKITFEDGTSKLVPQIGTDNFSQNSGGYFDHVVYAETANLAHKFGSKSTYKNIVLTGSRRDVVIESLPTPSLKPFFDVLIEVPEKVVVMSPVQAASIESDAEKAKKVLEGLKK